MDEFWGADAPDIDETVPPKRQRLFIARQACEHCRLKKTRCDGGNPCGLCRAAGAECRFAERKATKNEVSLGMIFNTLQRIEAKIEGVQSVPVSAPEKPETTSSAAPLPISSAAPSAQATPAPALVLSTSPPSVSAVRRTPRHVPVIQYPIRQLPSWPAVRVHLDKAAEAADDDFAYDSAAATLLEQRRPRLAVPPLLPGSPDGSGGGWLAQLHVSVVKELGDHYFDTFNLSNPVLDRRLFSQHSLAVAISTGFGTNMESCVVLTTMALGVLGKKALEALGALVPDTGDVVGDDSGLLFFNEARQRVGLLDGDNSLQACQYHLLSGLFYSQLLRPIDWWSCVTRAVVCCTSFWACVPKDCDEWTMDMQARLFWITAMFEAVLTQELDLPVSNLLSYEDRVPLPRFVSFPGVSSLLTLTPTATALPSQEDAFCHYHFLSQIAHRIILSRLCDSLFASRSHVLATSPSEGADTAGATTLARSDYPPQALEAELLHQLEQWRSQLPDVLQWDRPETAGAAAGTEPKTAATPAQIMVVPWLKARYCIARYHLHRPLLHRALHHPDWMTADELDKCRDALEWALDWIEIIRPTLAAMDCLPLKYFVCTQLFGQLLLAYTLDNSDVPTLRQLVPSSYATWRLVALQFLEQCAVDSPSVAREYHIAATLHGYTEGLEPVPVQLVSPPSTTGVWPVM